MKLEREAYALYLDTAWNKTVADASKATFAVIGEDIEDLSVELNADTESFKNILGQSRIKHNGYEGSADADPFYADSDSPLYEKLRDIALDRLKGDSCKTLQLEVIIEDTEATTHEAWLSEVMVVPQSYGGDTSGFQIPFSISDDGARVKGTVTAASVAAGAPVFTAAA